MVDFFPRGQTAIVGAATYGQGVIPGLSEYDIAALASKKALDDAGLRLSDVDGLFIVTMGDALNTVTFAQYLGISPKFTDNCRTGGSSFQIQAMIGAMAIMSGQCETVLIAYGSNQRSASGKLVRTATPYVPWMDPYKPKVPLSSYALATARHMYQYGTTKEQLGEVALAARQWAQKNLDAFARDPLTMDEYLASRMVCDPLGKLDCCLVTDGGAAVVITRADRAKDLVAKPAYILGGAAAATHREIASMPDLTVTGLADASRRAFSQAHITTSDVDVVELYDAFTINTILFLEDMGFCPKGEGGRFVEGGRIAPGGELPVNTNGGGLSCTHPGMYGLFTMVEATKQLMGKADQRQIADVNIALAHGNGGELSSQALLVLGSESTL
jgi:acetyl-CoA acetyltransferase